MTALKEAAEAYHAWTEREQETANDYSAFVEADERGTRNALERWALAEKRHVFFLFVCICSSPLLRLSEENDERKAALLAQVTSWDDAGASRRCPVRETALELWHTSLADALQRRRRALERRLRRFEADASLAEETGKKNEEKNKLREALLGAEQFTAGLTESVI
jgi:hypothetical protein